MCFTRPEHFTILLFVYIISYTPSSFKSITFAASLNSSEEIKHIFNSDAGVRNTTLPYTNGIQGSGNFAEGGLLNVNIFPPTVISPTKINNISAINQNFTKSNNDTKNFGKLFQSHNTTFNTNNTLHKLSTIKSLLPTKLNDTGSNLFLGVPEVIHINGTSSIKPRKGVYYNKIVPRKGVENESGANHSDSNSPCVWLGEGECYYSKDFYDVNCDCCKEGNALGKVIRENNPVACKNCKHVIQEFPDNKHICENVCCYHRFEKTVSISNTQDIFYKNISSTHQTEFKKDNSSSHGKIIESSSNKTFANLKRKPSVTKVPYDVEVVTEILSKAKQKVFVPVIVSVLLLPLIGILVFFVLRKTKEIWDKRYYKRMDFLIDGMYQD